MGDNMVSGDTLGIGGFQPFSLSDFPGRTAAIVFTQGCNFRCPYCHNRSLWPSRPPQPPVKTVPEVLAFLTARGGRLGGLVVTGGEPTLQADLAGFLAAVKGLGLAVKLDTNGSRPAVIAPLLADGLVDYIAMDVKAPWEKYDLLCGGPVDSDAIQQSMALVAASGVAHHFRTTFYRALLTESDLEAIKAALPSRSEFRLQACEDGKATNLNIELPPPGHATSSMGRRS
jgi:pyruvate formate lyase activating enzyme